MTMEHVVKLSEQFVDAQMSVDEYRVRLVAAITTLDELDIIVIALVLVAGPSTRQ